MGIYKDGYRYKHTEGHPVVGAPIVSYASVLSNESKQSTETNPSQPRG